MENIVAGLGLCSGQFCGGWLIVRNVLKFRSSLCDGLRLMGARF